MPQCAMKFDVIHSRRIIWSVCGRLNFVHFPSSLNSLLGRPRSIWISSQVYLLFLFRVSFNWKLKALGEQSQLQPSASPPACRRLSQFLVEVVSPSPSHAQQVTCKELLMDKHSFERYRNLVLKNFWNCRAHHFDFFLASTSTSEKNGN
jgi:hypothetical protein